MKKPAPAILSTRELFAANLRALRRAKELSQEAAADAAGISRAYWSSVERGVRNISIDNIEKVATALDTSPMVLFDPNLLKQLRGE